MSAGVPAGAATSPVVSGENKGEHADCIGPQNGFITNTLATYETAPVVAGLPLGRVQEVVDGVTMLYTLYSSVETFLQNNM